MAACNAIPGMFFQALIMADRHVVPHLGQVIILIHQPDINPRRARGAVIAVYRRLRLSPAPQFGQCIG